MKVACTVWSGGKLGDYFKELPIAIYKGVLRKHKARRNFADTNCGRSDVYVLRAARLHGRFYHVGQASDRYLSDGVFAVDNAGMRFDFI